MEENNFSTATPLAAKFAEIETKLIDDPERPMRTDLSRESIDDLVSSIKQVGMIEPIVVRAVGERYEVVAGHRRITAAEAAGLMIVPCHIVQGSQEQIEMMKIHENLYRVDVNPYDEALHYQRLMREMKLSPTKIARITNRSDGYVRDRLMILDFDSSLQQALADGKVNLTVAKELYRIKDPIKLREMLGYAVGQGITGAVAKRWVDEQQTEIHQAPGLAPMIGEGAGITPASEQHSECFYCLQPVRLFDAYTVYVHDHCVAERQAQAIAEVATSTPNQEE